MPSWPHSQLLLAWLHRCDMHFHLCSCVWSRRPIPSLLSLFCQSLSQPPPNTQGQHITPLFSPIIPFSVPAVAKINKRKKSVRIFQQSLSPSRLFNAVSSLFCEVAGLSQAAVGLFEVRMNNYSSGMCSDRTVGREKKVFKKWHKSNKCEQSLQRVWTLTQASDPILLKRPSPETRHRGSWIHQVPFQSDIKYICGHVMFNF